MEINKVKSLESKQIEVKDKKLKRLIILFDFLNASSKKIDNSELLEELRKKNTPISINTLKADIKDLFEIYDIVNQNIDKTSFKDLNLDRRQLIKLKNPDYKLVIEILNGLFSNTKSSTFSIVSDFQDLFDLKPEGLINFESSEKQLEIVNNKDFLLKIIEAIKNEKQIKITLKQDNQKVDCSPSLIKVFNKRWYLIGIKKIVNSENKIEYEIERFRFNDIQKIDESEKRSVEKKIKSKELTNNFFKNRIGVSFDLLKQNKIDKHGNVTIEKINYDNEIEHTIVLKIDRSYYEKYFKEKPLFSKELNLNENQRDLELDGKHKLVKGKIKINKELVTALFSYKSYVEVLEPKFLRNHMIEVIKDLNIMYDVKITTDNSTYS